MPRSLPTPDPLAALRRAGALLTAAALLSACAPLYETGEVAQYRNFYSDPLLVALPANAPSITQQFAGITPDGEAGHLGIDIAAPVGTPVRAAAAGRVYLSYYEPMYGHRIIIDHGTGPDGRRSFTVYKHLDSRRIEAGTPVAGGAQIGTLGETGLLSSFPHLHFEVLRETAPGRRWASGGNWWQGMMQEDPNLFWAAGPGRPDCTGRTAGGQGPLPLTYPVACAEPL